MSIRDKGDRLAAYIKTQMGLQWMEQPQQAPQPIPTQYQVKPGDNLSSIAQQFGVPIQAVMGANGNAFSTVSKGQVIGLPRLGASGSVGGINPAYQQPHAGYSAGNAQTNSAFNDTGKFDPWQTTKDVLNSYNPKNLTDPNGLFQSAFRDLTGQKDQNVVNTGGSQRAWAAQNNMSSQTAGQAGHVQQYIAGAPSYKPEKFNPLSVVKDVLSAYNPKNLTDPNGLWQAAYRDLTGKGDQNVTNTGGSQRAYAAQNADQRAQIAEQQRIQRLLSTGNTTYDPNGNSQRQDPGNVSGGRVIVL